MDEVPASGQFRIVEGGVEALHLLFVVRIKTAVLRTDDHRWQRNLAIRPPSLFNKVLHRARSHILGCLGR